LENQESEMIMENNSEQTVTKVFFVLSAVVLALSGAVSALMDTPLNEQWPWLATVATVLVAIGQVAKGYIGSRPAKHAAMAAKVAADAQAAAVAAGNPPK